MKRYYETAAQTDYPGYRAVSGPKGFYHVVKTDGSLSLLVDELNDLASILKIAESFLQQLSQDSSLRDSIQLHRDILRRALGEL